MAAAAKEYLFEPAFAHDEVGLEGAVVLKDSVRFGIESGNLSRQEKGGDCEEERKTRQERLRKKEMRGLILTHL